ncbi:MAG: hypothetical protein E6Q50_07985 [Lysobacter sp.]|nr:MAG: hypothetical protein E6Q50_07985 [Lysobacter sp.]
MTTTLPNTGRFLCGPTEIAEALRSYVDSREPLAMAIAFWGAGACNALGIDTPGRAPIRILLNATSGACNPSELQILLGLAPHVEVRSDPELHAKVALCGKKTLVGSANASANGLGFEGKEMIFWKEASIEVMDDAISSESWTWFDGLWKAARKLDSEVIEQAKIAWRISRLSFRQRRPLTSGDSISPSSVSGIPIFVALTSEEADYDSKEALRQARERGYDLSRIDFYQSWPKIPKQSLLLAYDHNKRKDKIIYDNSFRTFESNRAIRLKNGGHIYPVEVARVENWREFGIERLSKSDLISLLNPIGSLVAIFQKERAARRIFMDERTSFDSPTNWCVRLDEFLCACEKYSIPLPPPFCAT